MKKILFVDDVKNVLNSLRLSLRAMSDEWDMVFALGGKKALDLLRQSRFDLLVTDMRMPGIDGARLLTVAHHEYPSMRRIVLSGYAEQDCVLKNISLTHHYLSKPCPTEKLVATIQNALIPDDSFENERMKEIISNLQSLPALPNAYRDLTTSLQDNNTSLENVCHILRKDMALTATVLRVTNCAFFGLGNNITSLDQAVNILGAQTLRTLVLSTHLFSSFDHNILPVFCVSKLWQHCLRVSGFARLIATKENLPAKNRDDCAMAGMLHDIGKIVLSFIMPKEFKKIMDTVHNENCAVYEAERKILKVTHAEVGAYLMKLWGFNDSQINYVKFHHINMCTEKEHDLVQKIIYSANMIDHEISQTKKLLKIKNQEDKHTKFSKIYELWKSECRDNVTRINLHETIPFIDR